MTSDQSSIEKRCIICGTSCAGQPRIKDATGKYAHKACANKQAKVQPTIQPLDLSPEEEPEMAAFLDDLPSPSDQQPSSGIRAACPSCGTSVANGAIICMNCGQNIQTGKGIKTFKSDVSKERVSEKSTVISQGSDVALGILKPIIGACIGGAIGAAIWAAISYYTNYEVGYVAVLVGILTGYGAVVGAGGGGEIVAMIALVVAVLSIGAGKYTAINAYLKFKADPNNLTRSEINQIYSPNSLMEEEILQFMVDVHAIEILDSGESIDWPNPETTIETAIWPNDYPNELVEYTTTTWETLEAIDREMVLHAASEHYTDLAYDDPESFISTTPIAFADVLSTLGFYDIIWVIAAMYGTWQVAARDY